MAEVTLDQLRSRLAGIDQRRAHYEWKSDHTAGRLMRHEVWRHDYLSFPYLVGAPDHRVEERFRDIFINTTELGNNGKIGLLPVTEPSFMQKFTHMLEEYEFRGGIPDNVVINAGKPISRYFQDGAPIAVKMFGGYKKPATPFLAKYGRKQFLEPMLNNGIIRVCNAGFYSLPTHNDAIRDDEVTRIFIIPTFRERLEGKDHIFYQGHKMDFDNNDMELPVVMPDYFFLSFCSDIYYRMPTDFDADAALIIRDPIRFSQLVISTFLAKNPDWEPNYGPVTYYDPYRDYGKLKIPEMSKHFGYSYQREVRIAFISKKRLTTTLQPEFINIGSMKDYAELVSV